MLKLTADRFRKMRQDMHLSQPELADLLGRSTLSISHYETGHSPIPHVVAALFMLAYSSEETALQLMRWAGRKDLVEAFSVPADEA